MSTQVILDKGPNPESIPIGLFFLFPLACLTFSAGSISRGSGQLDPAYSVACTVHTHSVEEDSLSRSNETSRIYDRMFGKGQEFQNPSSATNTVQQIERYKQLVDGPRMSRSQKGPSLTGRIDPIAS